MTGLKAKDIKAMNEQVRLDSGRREDAGMAWFISSAAAILALTGLAKTWSAFGHARFLIASDPITGFQFAHLMLAVGVLELGIAGVCLLGTGKRLSLALIAWLATDFVVYRFGLWWMGWKKPCACMGNLTDALHIPPQLADNAMKMVLAYLLVGSYAALFWVWRKQRASPTTPSAGDVVTAA